MLGCSKWIPWPLCSAIRNFELLESLANLRWRLSHSIVNASAFSFEPTKSSRASILPAAIITRGVFSIWPQLFFASMNICLFDSPFIIFLDLLKIWQFVIAQIFFYKFIEGVFGYIL